MKTICTAFVFYQDDTETKNNFKLVIEFALVSQGWFKIISNSIATEQIVLIFKATSKLEKSIPNLSKTRSIIQFKSIRDLYFQDQPYEPDNIVLDTEIIDYISRFNNLEHCSFKLELFVDESIFWETPRKFDSIKDIDTSVIEKVQLNYNTSQVLFEDLFHLDLRPIDCWRVDSLYYGFDGISKIGPFPSSNLFAIESLISVKISSCNYINVKDLKLIVNNHIESFEGCPLLGWFGYDENEELEFQDISQPTTANRSMNTMNDPLRSTHKSFCDFFVKVLSMYSISVKQAYDWTTATFAADPNSSSFNTWLNSNKVLLLCQLAFDTIKSAIKEKPSLFPPNYDLPFIFECDASDVGTGYRLFQMVDGKENVICYGSKKLKDSETRYSTLEKELLAIVTALKANYYHIFGRDIEIRTDHKNITYINEANKIGINQTINRWIAHINLYQPKIKFIKGKDNTIADGLSRYTFNVSVSLSHPTIANDIIDGYRIEDDSNLSNGITDYTTINGLRYTHDGKIIVPRVMSIVNNLLYQAHDSEFGCHRSASKTLHSISELYVWPNMAADIKKYCDDCIVCRRASDHARKRIGHLIPLPIPVKCFQRINIDFIPNLPVEEYMGRKVDAIMVVIDALIQNDQTDSFRFGLYQDGKKKKLDVRYEGPRKVSGSR
ncbi:pol polyprotein [Heterostelium album PN500]|uniref:Pol polyprotein n=1 Tax=Heterostelium pallidum (strain ATCC 26659 / Pp 5 / PN500) TaxID=670386 RepID=D3BVJ1_HETP5|nr:pol polyprotein [Heterostelium album PN500]EFA74614.1 pol polyprotein [Heterostelium album PN500]|eukprot:XP_020426748.1 pol polyprotein [Heterostelium album PN500]